MTPAPSLLDDPRFAEPEEAEAPPPRPEADPYKLPVSRLPVTGDWASDPRRGCAPYAALRGAMDLWFPDDEMDPEQCAEAKAVCAQCPFGPTWARDARGKPVCVDQGPCLAYAVENHVGDSRKTIDGVRQFGGIWGGMTTRERENVFYHQPKKQRWREAQAAAGREVK